MAAFFATILGICSIFISYFLYDFSKQNFIRETEAAIDNEINNIIIISGDDYQIKIPQYISSKDINRNNTEYLYSSKNDKFIAGTIKDIPIDISLIKEGVISFNLNINYKKILFAGKIHTFSDDSQLLVARDITEIIKSYNHFKWLSIIIMIFMLVVVLVSFFISIFVVNRINKIASTARNIIKTGDLTQRIKIDSNWDDLSYLSMTLNELLSEIERLIYAIKNVSDNISHDLRTPIARLRNDLVSMKTKNSSKKDILNLISEADHILSIFNSILRISKIEKGLRKDNFLYIKLDNVIKDVLELYDPLIESNNISIIYNINIIPEIYGDRDLLFQMFANIIDNSVKFCKDNGKIEISLYKEDNKIIMTISDDGIGIDINERDKIFDRFYRCDKSRNIQGSGLGLSMVKAIIDLHNFNISVEDSDIGSTIKIILN